MLILAELIVYMTRWTLRSVEYWILFQ